MREIENIAQSLFEKIRSRFDNVSLGDENAKSVQDPDRARFINFEYVSSDGTKFGNVTISLIDETSLKVYFNKDINDKLDELHKDEWFTFLRNLRQFAKRNMLTFDTRDIARSNLNLKDIKQQSKADSTLDTDDIQVTESRLFGTSRTSYQECGPVRILIRHSDHVDETKRGARTRKIEAIYLETQNGERRLLDSKNIHGARAMAVHCANGGVVDDEIGESISSMCQEMANMAHFVRATSRREFEDAETSSMAKAAVHHYNELKSRLKRIGNHRGYHEYAECYMPEADIEEEIDVDALRERFVKKIYDDRFEEALPYVYRAYRKQQAQMENSMSEEFEMWANEITEGTWAIPDSDSSVEELDEIMSKPLKAGPQGENASGVLYNIIGDDKLFDQFYTKAEEEGEEADVRPLVIQWLLDNGYAELSEKYNQPYTQNTAPLQAQDQAVQQQQAQQNMGQSAPVGNNTMGEPNVQEQADPLEFIKSLAGIRK